MVTMNQIALQFKMRRGPFFLCYLFIVITSLTAEVSNVSSPNEHDLLRGAALGDRFDPRVMEEPEALLHHPSPEAASSTGLKHQPTGWNNLPLSQQQVTHPVTFIRDTKHESSNAGNGNSNDEPFLLQHQDSHRLASIKGTKEESSHQNSHPLASTKGMKEELSHQNSHPLASIKGMKEDFSSKQVHVPGRGSDRTRCFLEGEISIHGAKAWINGQQVFSHTTDPVNSRDPASIQKLKGGVSVLVLHQHDPSRVMLSKHFKTYTNAEDTRLEEFLNTLQEGRLLVFMGSPNFVSWLREGPSAAIRRLTGAEADFDLTAGESWALVAYTKGSTNNTLEDLSRHRDSDKQETSASTGRQVLYEGHSDTRMFNGSAQLAQPQWFSLTIDPKTGSSSGHCSHSLDPEVRRRALFCDTYEGYKDFCSCHNPLITNITSQEKRPPREMIPVVVVGGGKRLPQVLHQVVSIRSNKYGRHTPVLLSVDGQNEEARMFAELVNIPVVFNLHNKGVIARHRINEHIKFSLESALLAYPDVDKVIVLEDDLKLAPDFISYFQQAGVLLSHDPTVMFVNAYRYNAYPHTARDPSVILRSEGYPYYGWMVQRADAINLLGNWTTPDIVADWDLYIKVVMRGHRRTIIPEVPRTKHMGSEGVHVSGMLQEVTYSRRPLNTALAPRLALARTWELAYNIDLAIAIDHSTAVHIREHPCSHSPVPRHQNTSYALYIAGEGDTDDNKAYYVLARCLGLYDEEMNEHYELTMKLRYYDTQFFIVVCPTSPFCTVEEDLWYTPTKEEIERANMYQQTTGDEGFGSMSWRLVPFSPEEEFDRLNVHTTAISFYMVPIDNGTKELS